MSSSGSPRDPQVEWVRRNAARFRLATVGRVPPGHPGVSVAYGSSYLDGEYNLTEANEKIAELSEAGIRAVRVPTPSEIRRLSDLYDHLGEAEK